MVPRHLVVEILAPGVKDSGLDLVALDHVREIDVVVAEGQRLQRVDVPLVQRNFLSVAPQFVANDAEGLEFVVATLIEARVLVELSK